MRNITRPSVNSLNAADDDQEWSTSTFAGKCRNSGDEIGALLQARFGVLRDVAIRRQQIYIIDYRNFKIKQLDMKSKMITTIYESVNIPLFNIALGLEDNQLYVTAEHGILHFKNRTLRWLAGSKNSNSVNIDGKFGGAGFSSPRGIAWLNSWTLLVAGLDVSAIKVVDLKLNTVKTICTGKLKPIFKTLFILFCQNLFLNCFITCWLVTAQ